MSSVAATHKFVLPPVIVAILIGLFCVAATMFITDWMSGVSATPIFVGAVHT